MNPESAEASARQFIKEHLGPGWRFEWTNSDRLFGGCESDRKTIQLSRHFVKSNGPAEVLDTILHEIAHGLTPKTAKPHGAEWKATAIGLGARPEPCKDALIYPHQMRTRNRRGQWMIVGTVLALVVAVIFVTTPGFGSKPVHSHGRLQAAASPTGGSIGSATTLAGGGTTTSVTTVPAATTTTARVAAAKAPAPTKTTTKAPAPTKTTTTSPPATAPTTTTTTIAIPVTTTTFGCTKDADGDCYYAEETCPSNFYNQTVAGADGPITCTQIGVDDWRWVYT